MFGYLGFSSYIYSKLTLMKKSQLRQIIKEEYQKLLKEEVSQFLIDSFIEGVKDAFGKESNLYATKGDEYEKLKTAAEEVIASTDSGDVTVEELIDASQLYAFGLKEIKTSPHQFGSDEEKDYQIAAAKLSNAVLHLDPDDPTTMNMAQVAYKELGPKLEAHLRERFGGDTPKSFR